jgi:membrane protease YdiL (CAAX protease family)
MNPETTMLVVNAVVIALAYTLIYPRVAGSNMGKMAVYDMVLSLIPLSIGWWLYAESGHQFNLIIMQTNWFVFTLATYFIVEMPMSIGYMRAFYKDPSQK